jgi:hypothetical protein
MIGQTFFEVVTLAINDLIENGYDSEERLTYWIDVLRQAALEHMIPESELDAQLRRVLAGAYERLVERASVLKFHKGVDRFTLARIKPRLRKELDRRIVAAADLIKLNREQTINDTIRRFQGWATSIPEGGTRAADRVGVKNNIRSELASTSFRERRVLIDQGHKLNAAISDILASDGGAIAARWRSNWRQLNYNYREDHKERDQEVYTIRGNWALQARLMKVGEPGYTDEITQPGEEVYCRCFYVYLYNLRDLPARMLTAKGKAELAGARASVVA